MAEQPEVTMENLREMTEKLESPGADEPQIAPDSETPPAEGATPAAEAAPETSKSQEAKPDISDSLKGLFGDTPYKSDDVVDSAKKIVEGYKNLQAELTRRSQETKPYEQFLRKMSTDRTFANFVEQARQMYENPQLAQPYLNQNQGKPNPANYFPEGYVTPEGMAKYQSDLEAYFQRDVDSRLNSRLSEMETRNQRENLKLQFRQKFPSENPDDLLDWWSKEAYQFNPFEIAYKMRNFDTVKSSALDEARKELNRQLEEAQKNKTPQASASTTQKVKATDIIDYIGKHGLASAQKKFTQQEVSKVLMQYS